MFFLYQIILSLVIYYVFGAWDYALLLFGLAFAVGIAIVIYNDGDSIEKDRILVTYLAFLIVIVFWGAFEHAGGLMNVYAKQKTDLSLFGLFDVPASWFQSVNAIFIIISLLPFNSISTKSFQTKLFIVYFVFNGLAYATNFFDFIYYKFSQSRLTTTIFDVVGNESNKLDLLGSFAIDYWHVFVLYFFLKTHVMFHGIDFATFYGLRFR